MPSLNQVRFSGLHPEAVVGADIKASGVTAFSQNTNNLFSRLKHEGNIGNFNHRTLLALSLKREPANAHDPNAIGVYALMNGQPRQIGYVPATVTKRIAALMDAGHDFAATLTKLKPFQLKGQRHHQAIFRLEYIAKPDLEPAAGLREQVEQAFTEAREQEPEGFNRVLNVVPEAVNTYDVKGARLVERLNAERAEATYYLNGQTITKVQLDPTQTVKPVYRRQNLPKAVKDKVSHLINTQA